MLILLKYFDKTDNKIIINIKLNNLILNSGEDLIKMKAVFRFLSLSI